MRCFRKLIPWLVGALILGILGSWITARGVQSALTGETGSMLAASPDFKGLVHVDKFDGQWAYLSGPKSMEATATAAVAGQFGVTKVFYAGSADPAPATTVAPATTLPATTVAPATTAAPTTVPAPTTTAPAPTTTAAPATTVAAAPLKACPALPPLTGVNFETNSATLAGDAPAALASVLTALKAASGCKVEIIGHTDQRGTDAANQTLSEARAASVVEYLVGQGIPAGNLTSSGKGESDPVPGSDQNTDAGLAVNRRIEFKPTNVGN